MIKENLDVRADEKTVKAAKKEHKAAKAVMAGMLAMALGGAGALAYFTGMHSVDNKFTISTGFDNDGDNKAIEVVEPTWDDATKNKDGVPTFAENLYPLKTVAKDPFIQNNSDVEAWMFAKVYVPMGNVSTVNDDGTLVNDGTPANQPLFTLIQHPDALTGIGGVAEGTESLDMVAGHDKWVLVDEAFTVGDDEYDFTPDTETIDDVTYMVYTYKYTEKVPAKVGDIPGRTQNIFDAVQLINLGVGADKGELGDAQGMSVMQHIKVEGFGVQTEGVDSIDQAMAIYLNQHAA